MHEGGKGHLPNLANARGGVPNASRNKIGREGFFSLIPRYDFSTKELCHKSREKEKHV